MHPEVMKYVDLHLGKHDFNGKSVLDVGSLNVNGSMRDVIFAKDYTGIDMLPGRDVNIVTKFETWVNDRQYDYVISSSCLEHCENWREVLLHMKEVLKPEGYLLVTTHNPTMPYHAYPDDHWRWTPNQWKGAFTDMEIIDIDLGSNYDVMVYCKKPLNWEPHLIGEATPVERSKC